MLAGLTHSLAWQPKGAGQVTDKWRPKIIPIMMPALVILILILVNRPWRSNVVNDSNGQDRSTVRTIPDPGPQELNAKQQSIKAGMESLLAGDGDWSKFSMTYSDLHGFHGGIAITIDGSGKVTQSAVGEPLGKPRDVAQEELVKLVTLLCELRAWEQWAADRPPELDESQAWIGMSYDGVHLRTWEWYNDMPRWQRIMRIREAGKHAAWEPQANETTGK
jgi:hypothetical protein